MQLQFYPTVVSCNKLPYLGEDRLPHYAVKLLRAFRVNNMMCNTLQAYIHVQYKKKENEKRKVQKNF